MSQNTEQSTTLIAVGIVGVVTAGVITGEALGSKHLRASAEQHAGRWLPGTSVSDVAVHGFPNSLSALLDNARQVDIDATTPSGANIYAIAAEPDLSTGHVDRITYVVTLPKPAEPMIPIPDPDGGYTERYNTDGKSYTSAARLDGQTLTVSSAGPDAPEPVSVPLSFVAPGTRLDGQPFVTPRGLRVRLASPENPDS